MKRLQSRGTVIMVRKKSVQRSLFLEFREPWQRGLAIALGVTLGLLPKFNLIFVALLLVTLIFPIPLILCLAIGCIVSLISPQLSGIEDGIGSWILGHSRLQGLWESLFSVPLFRASGFQNTQVMGSLCLALGGFYPAFLITTTYFQRRRQLDREGLLETRANSTAQVHPPMLAVKPGGAVSIPVNISMDSPLKSSQTSSSPANPITTMMMNLPTATSMTNREAVIDTVLSQPVDIDIEQAEEILNELVSAKQLELHQHNLNGHSNLSPREIEEQQWVLDTLIEIIRLKDEAVKSQETQTNPTQSIPTVEMRNLLAPLTSNRESDDSQVQPAPNTMLISPKHIPEKSMDKLTRTDSSVSSGVVNAIGSSDKVERMSSAPPSPVNVVPQSARPRSMHNREESLRFLIHHLQCLQRERQE